jgi:hypothetical protein
LSLSRCLRLLLLLRQLPGVNTPADLLSLLEARAKSR